MPGHRKNLPPREWRPTWKPRKADRIPPPPPPEPNRHDEICNKIIDEMRVMSREEWFKIAKLGKTGAPGFSPMRQLQFKIRDNPLTIIPEITGIFRTPAGKILQRIIPWPSPGWTLALKQTRAWGYAIKAALDLHPYRTIDPVVDELDHRMAEYGEQHPYTLAISRKLCSLCLKDFNYDHINA
jgi:hypothetical protein